MSVPATRMPMAIPGGQASQTVVRDHVSNELIFAVVGHVGSGTTEIAKRLKAALENRQLTGGPFDVEILKARGAISAWATARKRPLPGGQDGDLGRVIGFQDLGDEMRAEDHAAVACALVAEIRKTRAGRQNGQLVADEAIVPDGVRRAYILDSIRHPAEVHLLRSLYQSAFTLIGVVADEEIRLQRLVKKYRDAGNERARQFMERDARAVEKHGQRVSDAFHLADFFLDNTQSQLLKDQPNKHWTVPDQLARLIKLITHETVVRPTAAESAMYAAYGAQLRSSCLSRQVGAALADSRGVVVSTGTNEAPCAGGGVYLEPDPGAPPQADGRCAFRSGEKFCASTREQNSVIESVVAALPALQGLPVEDVKLKLRNSRVGGLIEFSRAVHAEMDALLSAARRGVTVAGTRLFVTTYPCHYCARHVVAAGVDEVQFIEPYPKSQALKLHGDSITIDATNWEPPSKSGTQVLFHPYTGVAPRMYERAFLKDRPLKDDATGAFMVGTPDWGSAWDLVKVSYPELEVKLAKRVQ